MNTFINTQSKKFDAEVGKVLQLMIHSLYTNKDIFLRELVSNASDACDKLRYESLKDASLVPDEELKITIKIDKLRQVLNISDNGIGMSKDDMIENLGRIASSGTQKFLEAITHDKQNYNLIGQFGVGFYSAFMVADLVRVFSTKFSEKMTYVWESKGESDYNISVLEEPLSRGTVIELHIKSSEVEFLEPYRIKHIINTYSEHLAFPIELIEEGVEGSEVINSSFAIWTKNKSDLTNQQYIEFYQKISHINGDPLLTIHNKVEGNIEYTNLLFIPKTKPFDLFHPDRKTRVKLYVKKVFIADNEVELIPSYMRFLRGVVDSNDLPLNISRETLQNNATIYKIKKSIVKRVLTTLKQTAKENRELYDEFWMNFGEVMKEGLCEPALEEKEELLDACRFFSTKSQNQLISLQEYVDRMPSEQNAIFFVTGASLDSLIKNPQLEGFQKRNIEVLLLTDNVDEFWVNVINQYKNKSLKSVTNAEIDLDAIHKLNDERLADSEKVDDAQEDDVKNYIKKILGDRIKNVIISSKLVESPACLGIPDGAMNIRMENLLIEQKQLSKKAPKILEVNLNHHLLKKLISDLHNDSKSEQNANIVEIIFCQACLIAGEPLFNPSDFVAKLNQLLK